MSKDKLLFGPFAISKIYPSTKPLPIIFLSVQPIKNISLVWSSAAVMLIINTY